jgi:hypothetical protein
VSEASKTLVETLLILPQDGDQRGFFEPEVIDGLNAAATAGFVRKDRSRAKYGEIWWSLTPSGRNLAAQFRPST